MRAALLLTLALLAAAARAQQLPVVELSTGMHYLNWRYARDFNNRYELFGHVFAHRFKSKVIDSEEYVFDCCAYVLQNPVKAGLCERVEDWPWSYSRYGLAWT